MSSKAREKKREAAYKKSVGGAATAVAEVVEVAVDSGVVAATAVVDGIANASVSATAMNSVDALAHQANDVVEAVADELRATLRAVGAVERGAHELVEKVEASFEAVEATVDAKAQDAKAKVDEAVQKTRGFFGMNVAQVRRAVAGHLEGLGVAVERIGRDAAKLLHRLASKVDVAQGAREEVSNRVQGTLTVS
jgi:ABC-type transporter Mla subunit MlaD